MNTTTAPRIDQIAQAWGVLHEALGLAGPIKNEAHYLRLTEFAESLADTLPDNANEPLWGLVSLIGERIAEYEKRIHPLPDVPPHELFRELMLEWGLNQSDFPEVGTQSVISEILSGKRTLNLRQVKALAKRFAVPMEMFV
ncbi:MAG: transcriptional regulator [Azoarcus sp.]|jgi:HTH-type transcriptional regulator/antitoxin HigA|nr:transcriptional regulator [Azoarcus sp.]